MSGSGVPARILRWFQGRRTWALRRLRSFRVEPGAWLADRAIRNTRAVLGEQQLRDRVRSDTCFVMGSGQSLNEISAPEWARIARHNTIAFNYFIRARFVPVDFHLVGEMACDDDLDPSVWRPVVNEYARLVEENPFYSSTVLGLQEGLLAVQSNRLMASDALGSERKVFRYRRIAHGRMRPPSASLAEGLVHGAGSLVGCVNLASILGFREIVLAGVDLYDRRAFWHSGNLVPSGSDSSQGMEIHQRHATADAMVSYLGAWRPLLAARGVMLSVYNPRSLLARVLPVKPHLL